MKISVASSVFVNYSLREAIRIIANSGYDAIDIWGGRPHVYRRDYNWRDLKELRIFLEENNLKVSSFMPAFFRYPYSLSNPNDRIRQDSIDYMRDCMDSAAILEAEILLVIPGKSLIDQDLEDAKRRNIESIEMVCHYSQDYDFRLGLEPANAFVTDLVNTATDAIKIVDDLNFENLGVVLDTGHMNLVKDSPENAVRVLGDCLLQIHTNDNDGVHQLNLVPGDGNFDFPNLIDTLQISGFRGYLSAELAWDYSSNPEPFVKLAAKRLRELIDNNKQGN